MAPSKNKKNKEAQKATDKPDKPCKPWEEAKTIASGCNCPLGCLVGEAVMDGDDVVEVECSAPACPKDLRLHAVCYENWESELVRMVEKTNRRGGWRASWVQQHLWTPTCMRHVTSEFTKCQCGGKLVRVQPAIPVHQVVVAEKPAKKAKHHVSGGIKKLPVLRSNDVKFVSSGAHHQSQTSNSLNDEGEQPQEKRKYPVGFTPQPKKKTQSKSSNCAPSGTNTSVAAGSNGTGERSRISSMCPSDESDFEIAQQIAALKMFKLNRESERSGWEEVRSGVAGGKLNRSTGSRGIKIAGGKFHALVSDDSDDEPADALSGETAANEPSALDNDSASVVSGERPTKNRAPVDLPNTNRAQRHFASRVVPSSGYNDIDQFHDFYDISKHCIITDTQPFAYSRDSARLSALVRQLCMSGPIRPPRSFRAFQ